MIYDMILTITIYDMTYQGKCVVKSDNNMTLTYSTKKQSSGEHVSMTRVRVFINSV